MPAYDFHCDTCEATFERFVKLSEFDTPQACEACGAQKTRRLISGVNFVLSGDNWPGKNIRIKNQMAKKNERLVAKQNEFKADTGGVARLAPNVDGERTETWAEAKKLAESKGKNTESYNTMIQKEKSTP
jgi:putative FmdB family regulatory protein